MSGNNSSSETNPPSNVESQEPTRVITEPSTDSQTAPRELAGDSEKPAPKSGQTTSKPVDEPE